MKILDENPGIITEIAEQFVPRYPCHTILFVGAGASKDFGMPLMDGFFDSFFSRVFDIYQKIREGEFPPDAQDEEFIGELIYFAFNRTDRTSILNLGRPSIDLEVLLTDAQARLKVLKNVGSDYDEGLEDAFKFLLASETGFKGSTGVGGKRIFSGDFIGKYIAKFENAIRIISKALYRVYDGPLDAVKDQISNRYHPVFALLEGVNEENIAVFTTNYDRCLDHYIKDHNAALKREVVTCFTGFDVRKVTGEFRKIPYGRVADIKPYHLASGRKIISYFNLHGSVAWVPILGEVFYNENSNEELDPQNNPIPLAVPVVSKGEDMPSICRLMYEFFYSYLGSPNLKRILSIGFSFRDEEISRAIEEALTSRGVELIAVNPEFNPGGTFKKKEALDRIQVIPYKFGAPEVLPLVNKVLKRDI